MNTKTCRDCGNAVEATARGCPTCALNLEAEAMIDGFIWRRLLPGVITAAILAAGVLFYLLR